MLRGWYVSLGSQSGPRINSKTKSSPFRVSMERGGRKAKGLDEPVRVNRTCSYWHLAETIGQRHAGCSLRRRRNGRVHGLLP
jgi:hypothetical protein